ncbi:hypothetical protein [Burkholderia sp. BCC0397]|uniref:hypothetical protein n=1 Tax=Burkholderia sp. BCC0397 TaxID=486876 RepID=UPI00158E2EB6|nr:hypothetical protein [Burkholderia sp. BCC0397]
MADFAQACELRCIDQPVDHRKAIVMELGPKIGLHGSLDDKFTDREAMQMACDFSIFVSSRGTLLFDILRWLPTAEQPDELYDEGYRVADGADGKAHYVAMPPRAEPGPVHANNGLALAPRRAERKGRSSRVMRACEGRPFARQYPDPPPP